MKLLTALFTGLDSTNSTNDKVELLKDYFLKAADEDKLWTLALFTGRRPKRNIATAQIRQWAAEVANIPAWLFDESYHAVGDLGETISLLVAGNKRGEDKTLSQWFKEIMELPTDDTVKKEFTLHSWSTLSQQEILVFNKLLMGSLRVGVSQTLIVKAIADITYIPTHVIMHRIMGNWSPVNTTYEKLIFSENNAEASAPYPFYLAYPVEHEVTGLGEVNDWFAEWKWDGIRSQIIKRNGELFIWSRGEELVTDKFPELAFLVNDLPDGTVLDGELLCLAPGTGNEIQPLPFALLQTRISRKNVSKKIMEDAPAGLILYDILEFSGEDVRTKTHEQRRLLLEQLYSSLQNKRNIKLSPLITGASWDELKQHQQKARDFLAEGLMIKRKSATYQSGRKKGDWWKWKVEPLTADAVLIYAQKGHGKRAELFTDYTFALWDNGKLVSFAKAYSGLTDKEIQEVDKFIKSNTIEKFGPVRTVKPELVFELGFEGIQQSARHKSGIAVRFPRILRWRKDKKAEEADKLEEIKKLIA